MDGYEQGRNELRGTPHPPEKPEKPSFLRLLEDERNNEPQISPSTEDGPVRFVYFIQAEMEGQPIKVGVTDHPWTRLTDLQTGCPANLVMLGAIETANAHKLERWLHRQHDAHCVRGEWFRPIAALLDYIAEKACMPPRPAVYERPEIQGPREGIEHKLKRLERLQKARERAQARSLAEMKKRGITRPWLDVPQKQKPPYSHALAGSSRKEVLAHYKAVRGITSPPRPTVEGMGG